MIINNTQPKPTVDVAKINIYTLTASVVPNIKKAWNSLYSSFNHAISCCNDNYQQTTEPVLTKAHQNAKLTLSNEQGYPAIFIRPVSL
ncbi:hypothetical protein [Segetibacter aerophilus]|uniref:hypothetical protein n=1 Tax=Segetibacter aerophilus TaxID=670293 RepID=UPI0011BE2962|nr:hypothetical protein [Segetibacter aerophilus]